jgi:hypothetical protein
VVTLVIISNFLLSDPPYSRSTPSVVPSFTLNSTKPLRKPQRNWPPRPVVEDEHEALAKEYLTAELRATINTAHDPPLRGTVDQYPFILESDISPADAAELCDEQPTNSKVEDTGERRFVLVPKIDTFPQVQSESKDRRKASTEEQATRQKHGDTGKRSLGRHEEPAPPLGRRRSRTDLPSLQTKLGSEAPQFRKTVSDTTYTANRNEPARHGRTPSGDVLLSPDAVPYRGSRGYFDVPPKPSSRHSSPGSPGVYTSDKRRSTASPRPTTPTNDKKPINNSDAYREKSPRPPNTLEDSGNRRSNGRSASRPGHLDAEDHGRTYRRSSNQPSRNRHGSSSDDHDLSDSERRRGKDHHHRHGSATTRPIDDREYHLSTSSSSTRSPLESRPTNRYASPLPSPKVSPSQISPSDRVNDVRENRRPSPRPVSPVVPYQETPRSSNNSLGLSIGVPQRSRSHSHSNSRRQSPTDAPPAGSSSTPLPMPIPIPTRIDVQSPGESHRSPTLPQYDDDRHGNARAPPSPKPYWQPPHFEPPNTDPAYLERPLGSYRRFSQDVEEGNVAPLPPCPRTTPVRGCDDWLTLPKSPSFNICPSCYESIIAPTEFRAHFVKAPIRPLNDEVGCDFGSQPWYRIAWLLARKEHRKDLSLVRGIAEITETAPPCLGKHEATRKWYSIVDPETGNLIRNFDVCYSCVRCIETLLPSVRGIFVRADLTGPPGLPRVCDMRFDSKRFIHYFDALETMADTASKYGEEPDAGDFAELAKRYASAPECRGGETLHNERWHVITQLPEFTVCPECFDEAVLPGLGKRKAIPAMFNKSLQRIPVASCQLYSPRMRAIFDKAVNTNDYKLLAAKARDRKEMEVDLKEEMAEQRRMGKVSGKEMKALEAEWAKWE